jgi:carotenoid cleavage dioxygenase-like enzyme
MPSPTDRSNPSPLDADLDVCGAIPAGLSGRLVAPGPDGVIHSVLIGEGRASYSGRRLRTETVVHDLVYFGGSTLVFGDDASAYELGPAGDTLRRVDLAGQRRSLAVPPKQDAATGELHLIARDTNGSQAYVVVSAGALMRRSRPLLGTPERVHDLVISRDHAILVADGFVGVVSRNGELRSTWVPTGIEAARPVHAHDAGDTVIVLALTPVLERWTLHLEAGTIQREAFDPTPRQFAQCPSAAGDLVFVTDATRQRDADGGWLVGFVHHPSGEGADLTVIDAADIAGPPIASAHIPRLVPSQLRCTWIPSTGH